MRIAVTSKTSRERVREHRQRLRERGLKPVTLWLPDITSAAFREEARRQSLRTAHDPDNEEALAFIEEAFAQPDDE